MNGAYRLSLTARCGGGIGSRVRLSNPLNLVQNGFIRFAIIKYELHGWARRKNFSDCWEEVGIGEYSNTFRLIQGVR